MKDKSWMFTLAIMILFMRPEKIFPIADEAPASTAPLSEEGYLELVMARNNDLKALRKELEAQLFSIRAEMSIRRPSLALSAEESRWLHHDRGDRLMNLAASQRIDLLGRYGLQERDLLLGLEVLQCHYAHSVNELLAHAGSTYRRAVMAGLNQDTMELILRQRQGSLVVTQEKFDMELVPLLDLLRARSQVDEGEAFFLEARQNYEQQLIEMAALTGQMPVAPVLDIPPLTEEHELSVDPEEAWEHRPDAARLVLSRERAAIQRSLAVRGLAPFLELAVSLRLAESYRFSAMEGQQGKVFARAMITFPLVDGGKTANAKKAARLLLEKADTELEAGRDALKREVDLVRQRWQRALALEAIRGRQAASAAEELEIAEMMYREGLVSQLELINAQEADQRSRREHLSALQELWLVLAEADRVMGRYVAAAAK